MLKVLFGVSVVGIVVAARVLWSGAGVLDRMSR